MDGTICEGTHLIHSYQWLLMIVFLEIETQRPKQKK